MAEMGDLLPKCLKGEKQAEQTKYFTDSRTTKWEGKRMKKVLKNYI